MSDDFYHWQNRDLILHCHLQPGAKQSSICGRHGNRLKLRIAAPATEGKANTAAIAFLAQRFGVSKSQISITAGAQSRQKTLKITSPQRLPEELTIASPL